MNLLIIGGSGLLGINWALRRRRKENICLSMHKREIKIDGTLSQIINSDVPNYKSAVDQVRPDVIVNAAAITSIEYCEKNKKEAYKTNVELPEELAKISKRMGVKLIQISSDQVFDGCTHLSNENMETSPVNYYGITKAKAEKKVLDIHNENLVIRTNFFGWGTRYRKSFSDYIYQYLRQGDDMSLWNDVYFTPIYVGKLVDIATDLISKDAHGIINIGGQERVSKYQFGIKLASLFELDMKCLRETSLDEMQNIAKRPKEMGLSVKLLKDRHGIETGDVKQNLLELLEELNNQEEMGVRAEL